MCGICGFLGPPDRPVLEGMTRQLTHRGPDAEGLFVDAATGVHLGHRRLSIIDLAGGTQPMWTADGQLGIVFNGEIYNHLELRAEMEALGHRFQTDHSDTETLLHAYRQWGMECVHRLNGMWAFAIYDQAQRRLFLSRDRFGKKPLYYFQYGGVFAFSSELTALLAHPACPRDVDRLSLRKYFAYGYIPAPRTILKHVHKLPGGHNAHVDVDSGDLAAFPYWRFELQPMQHLPANPEEEWGEQLRELLSKAVQRRLMSDVPLGVLLSGGIDSSAVAHYAVQHAQEQVRTFSVGFQEASFNESQWSTMMADLLGTDHHLSILSIDAAKELLPMLPRSLDEPMGDSSLLPTSLLCQETRKQVTVALGGDGADELFAGYDPFKALRAAAWYDRVMPRPVHEGLRLLLARLPVSHANISLDFKIKRFLRGMSYAPQFQMPVWMGPMEQQELDALFAEPCELEAVYSEALEAWERCRAMRHASRVDQALQFYTDLYLQDDILAKADRASMCFSLELRSPFLDVDLADFVRRIPGEWKFRQGQTKYILKKALEPVLPSEILYRAKKGFGVPIGQWFMDGALPQPAPGPALQQDEVNRRMRLHKKGNVDDRLFLWNAWLYAGWAQERLQ